MTQGVRAEAAGAAISVFSAGASGRTGAAGNGDAFERCLNRSSGKTGAAERSPEAAKRPAESNQSAGTTADRAEKAQNSGPAGTDSAGTDPMAANANQAAEKPADAAAPEAVAGPEEELPDEAVEEAMAVLNGWLAQVAEELAVPVEEVRAWMSVNGMTAADMLNGENLKAMILDFNQLADASGLLTDEKAFAEWTAVSGELTELLHSGELAVSPEELAAMLEADNGEEAGMRKPDLEAAPGAQQPGADGLGEDPAVSEKAAVRQTQENGEEAGAGEETGSGADRTNSRSERHADVSEHRTDIGNLSADSVFGRLGEAVGQAVEISGGFSGANHTESILNQVVREIRVGMGPESTSMEMTLHPESLGRVNVAVASKNGIMTAQLTVQNQEAKEALESQMAALKQTFEEQGLKVSSVEVNVSEFSFGGSDQSGQTADQGGGEKNPGKRERRIRTLDELMAHEDEWDEEEELLASQMELTGSQVDYSA